ncbi:MAG TPA: hypothetical protein VIP10_11555 [Burkholderiaceae bacterium]
MLLEGRQALVWGTIVAALFSAWWLGATDGSLPRLGADTARAESRTPPGLMLKRGIPAAPATSSAH